MKSHWMIIIFLFVLAYSVSAEDQQTTQWLVAGPFKVTKPGFIKGENITGEGFGNRFILSGNTINFRSLYPEPGDVFPWNPDSGGVWQERTVSDKGQLEFQPLRNIANQVMYSGFYMESEFLTEYSIEIESAQMFEVYLNGERISSNYKRAGYGEYQKKTIKLNLEHGKSFLLVKSLYSDGDSSAWALSGRFMDTGSRPLNFSIQPGQGMNIHHLLEGKKLGSVDLSPDGTMMAVTYSEVNTKNGERKSWTEIKDAKTGQTALSFRKEGTTGFSWAPRGRKLYYTARNEFGSTIWVFDLENGKEYPVLENINDLDGYRFSDDEQFIIYGVREQEINNNKTSLRYMDELGNRTFQPQRETYLYYHHIQSGVRTRLTFGSAGTQLQDISPDGGYIVFSTSHHNPVQRPFTFQNMYLMDLNSGQVDTLWHGFRWGGSASFSPDGKYLLIQGGPDCFGEIGRNIGDQPIANNYDNQLYIYDLATGDVDPISRDFDPSVADAFWHPVDGRIYIIAVDQMYQRIFVWDTKSRHFNLIPVVPEVVGRFSVAKESLNVVYTGTSLGQYYKVWNLDLKSGKNRLIEDPESDTYRHVEFGASEEWDFTSSKGEKIRGFFLYPKDFDPAKQYPLIVNYYGGTMPISKSFGGRYPLDIWAGEGYVVYVPQPSGAIGFGQEFSARHQNNWGRTVADEIIEGTKKFMDTHSFVDSERVGCIGASYGGFMTMYLQTRTDIFSCAISHAGISSLSSYWGEGYWGYAYSSEATGDAYPWNRKDIYVNQSPLFSADRINTPLLLLHGSVDTNVPLGESLQLWVGLKILGRPVEMIQVEGEDHHILTYSKRIEWHHVIMAWFDKWLKEQNQDWEKLVPKSTL